MPISAVTPRAIESPEIPYDKVRYGLQISSYIDPRTRQLRASGTLTIQRARVLPPTEGSTTERWEDDPQTPPVTVPVSDWFDLAAKNKTIGKAMLALNEALAAYNTEKNLA